MVSHLTILVLKCSGFTVIYVGLCHGGGPGRVLDGEMVLRNELSDPMSTKSLLTVSTMDLSDLPVSNFEDFFTVLH